MVRSRLAGLAAGALLTLSLASAQADPFAMHVKITGLKAPASDSFLDQIDWSLVSSPLPDAMSGVSYSHSLAPYLTPIDLDEVIWSASKVPSGFTLDAGTGELSGSPSVADIGLHNITVTASRPDEAKQAVYTLMVNGIPLEVVQISTSRAHACAVTPQGGVKCWGRNADGQLGDGH